MGWWISIYKEIIETVIGTAFVFTLLTAMELATPIERPTMLSRLRALVFWVIWIPISILTFHLAASLWDTLGVHPFTAIPFGAYFREFGRSGQALSAIALAFFLDFFIYWYHRAQHRWLWRFHAVHHSVRELHAISSYHHISEPAFKFVLVIIPVSLVAPTAAATFTLISIMVNLQQTYLHSPTRLNFGRLRYIIADNRYHRIHHSRSPEHFDSNFGVLTPIWDIVFGTAYFPKPDEWPDVGLAEIDEPQTIREYLDLPFRFRPIEQDQPAPAE